MATKMTPEAAARIQSATAKSNGGTVPKGSFSSRASSAASKNTGKTKSQTTTSSGGLLYA